MVSSTWISNSPGRHLNSRAPSDAARQIDRKRLVRPLDHHSQAHELLTIGACVEDEGGEPRYVRPRRHDASVADSQYASTLEFVLQP